MVIFHSYVKLPEGNHMVKHGAYFFRVIEIAVSVLLLFKGTPPQNQPKLVI